MSDGRSVKYQLSRLLKAGLIAVTLVACGELEGEALDDQQAGSSADESESPEVAVVRDELLNASASSSAPILNATVWINGCTGTLVAPDVVLTCGHCFAGHVNAGVARQNGEWWPLAAADRVDVRFGPDPNNPVFQATGDWFNQVKRSVNGGHADILLFGLDALVPSSVAVPRAVMTAAAADVYTRMHSVYGYGSGPSPQRRTFASATGFVTTPAGSVMMLGNVLGGAHITGGDSGGPLYYGGTSGPLIGVTQGWNAVGTLRTTKTFHVGNADSADISGWLSRVSVRSKCSAAGSPDSVSDGGMHQALSHWWSVAREDNFATTSAGWKGCVVDYDRIIDHSGYGYFRTEGWVASPYRPQPSGTRTLYECWNASLGDNATLTTMPAGYSCHRTAGYVWTTAAADRVALRLWYSDARGDYFTTTQTGDYTSHGYLSRGVIGYVKTASSLR